MDPVVNHVAGECGDFAALLYTWMIPHAEDDTTIIGDPEDLYYLVCPRRKDKEPGDVEVAIHNLVEHNLLWSYRDAKGRAMLQFPPESFYKYQTYIPQLKRNYKDMRDVYKSETATNTEEQRETPQNPALLSFPFLSFPSPSKKVRSRLPDPPTIETQPIENPNPDPLGEIQRHIFDHWNSSGIIQHRQLTDQMRSAINGKLKTYSEAEICQSIANYSRILTKPGEFYFTYKWTLKDFLARGVDKFLDWEIASQNYLHDHDKRVSKAQRKEDDSCQADPEVLRVLALAASQTRI